MTSELAAFIRSRIPGGLGYSDAVELFIEVFSFEDAVPARFAVHTSKGELSLAFSELALEGWVHPESRLLPSPSISEQAHWNTVVASFLSGEIPRDPIRAERLRSLLS